MKNTIFQRHVSAVESKFDQAQIDRIVESMQKMSSGQYSKIREVLTSEYTHDDPVKIDYGNAGYLYGKIIKIAFTKAKVYYDIEVHYKHESGKWISGRVHNISSDIIKPDNREKYPKGHMNWKVDDFD